MKRGLKEIVERQHCPQCGLAVEESSPMKRGLKAVFTIFTSFPLCQC